MSEPAPRDVIRDYLRLARKRADQAQRLRETEAAMAAAHGNAVSAFRELGADVVVRGHGMEGALGEGVKVRAVPDSQTLTNYLAAAGRRDLLMPNFPALRGLAGHDQLPGIDALEISRPAQVNAKRITDKRRGSRRRAKGGV